MSMEIRPEFQPAVPGLVYGAEGSALADRIRSIHTLSKKRGIRPLTDFLDNRDIGEDDDPDAMAETRTDWYTPAEGLDAVRALIEVLQADPKIGQRWSKEDPDALETVLNDLEELVRCLEKAESRKAKFRLQIG
jgi:hypothetical protein